MTPEPEEDVRERTVSAVAGRAGLTKTHGALLLGGATALALGFVFLRGAMQHPKEKSASDQLRVRQTAHYEPAPLPPTPVIFRPPQPSMTPAPPPVVAPPPQQLPPCRSSSQTRCRRHGTLRCWRMARWVARQGHSRVAVVAMREVRRSATAD
jgi:hypothetical protein